MIWVISYCGLLHILLYIGLLFYYIGLLHYYLLFQPVSKYFTLNSNWITKWKSKGLSNESPEVVPKSDNTLTPSVNYYEDKTRLRFTGSVLQQRTVTYSNKKSSKS